MLIMLECGKSSALLYADNNKGSGRNCEVNKKPAKNKLFFFLRGRVETDGGSSQLTRSGICGGKKKREPFFIFTISYFYF